MHFPPRCEGRRVGFLIHRSLLDTVVVWVVVVFWLPDGEGCFFLTRGKNYWRRRDNVVFGLFVCCLCCRKSWDCQAMFVLFRSFQHHEKYSRHNSELRSIFKCRTVVRAASTKTHTHLSNMWLAQQRQPVLEVEYLWYSISEVNDTRKSRLRFFINIKCLIVIYVPRCGGSRFEFLLAEGECVKLMAVCHQHHATWIEWHWQRGGRGKEEMEEKMNSFNEWRPLLSAKFQRKCCHFEANSGPT